ncbi:Glycosyltransferase RgtA/B/C/D-like domain-containing protein [Frankia sp. AiPs1]|uniref:hypothetical protein n=1 Tax=Frankia sp. AiPa1 TaxID=573492 RepID=UPI00202AF143|nr:hypothetical protein [Frankia sp. AiPa1]MCL9760707.1 hypothetical protein [Frankia sp. AiPa1]
MRDRCSRRAAALAAGAVAAVLVGVLCLLRDYLIRPFWYDEIWRAHVVSEPARSLWAELGVANTPSALGWLGVTRLFGDAFGWHSWSLRLPGFLAVPLLGVAIVLVASRYAGAVTAVLAAGWICLNSTFLDLATQLKPYALETLASAVILILWAGDHLPTAAPASLTAAPTAPRTDQPGPPPREGADRGPQARVPAGRDAEGVKAARLVRRTAAGLVALFSVPGIFVIAPLSALDLWRGPRRRARLLECLPALALVGVHTVVFVAHQSSQRNGVYWDQQFLAGRGPFAALRFIAEQIRFTLTGSPPGIDRFDPSLVHGSVPLGASGPLLTVLLALVILGGAAVGTRTLARRPDGRQLLAALGGAELMMLGASAGRYWPFGPTRTNLFIAPMIVVVVMVGFGRVIRRLVLVVNREFPGKGPEAVADGPTVVIPTPSKPTLEVEPSHSVPISRSGSSAVPLPAETARAFPSSPPPTISRLGATLPGGASPPRAGRPHVALPGLALAAAALLALLGSGALLAANSTAGARLVWDHRDRTRGLDLMVDAAIATRRAARSGDVVAVGGRLARPGWLYAMEASDDGARDPADLPPVQSAHRAGAPVSLSRSGFTDGPSRIARTDTIFFGGSVSPLATQLNARRVAPRGLLVFVIDIESRELAGEVAALPRAGWCPARSWTFRLTGVLTRYDRCAAGGTASGRR